MEDKRCHRSAVATLLGWTLLLIAIWIIHDQPTSEPPVVLQWKPIQQGYHRITKSARSGFAYGVSILGASVVVHNNSHLTSCAKELDLFALNKRCVPAGLTHHLPHGGKRKPDKHGVVQNLLHNCLVDYLTLQIGYNPCNASLGFQATLNAPPEPHLDFAGYNFLTMFNTLSPIIEYPRFPQPVAYPPWPHMLELGEHIAPFPEAIRECTALSPGVPQ
jgi:hypothetical protein